MKKKVFMLVGSAVIMLIGYLMSEVFFFEFETCGVGYNRIGSGDFPLAPACEGYRGFLSNMDEIIGTPLFYFSLSFFIISLILFFVSNYIFVKWLKFASGYFIISWLIILSTPVSVNSFSPLTIEREIVSIWMSSLFLIISLILIIIWSIKEKKSIK